MIPTEILKEEHQIILKVLLCLEKIALEAAQEGKLNLEFAKKAIDFIQNFSDKCHHAKEEDRLFVVMEEEGIPREGGPIGCMLSEHEMGRNLVGEMISHLEGASRGTSSAIASFKEAAMDFIHLLSQHIYKEDHVLFPMADQVLDAKTMDKLRKDFQRIEAEAGTRHARYIQLAKELCSAYKIEFVDANKYKNISAEFGALSK